MGMPWKAVSVGMLFGVLLTMLFTPKPLLDPSQYNTRRPPPQDSADQKETVVLGSKGAWQAPVEQNFKLYKSSSSSRMGANASPLTNEERSNLDPTLTSSHNHDATGSKAGLEKIQGQINNRFIPRHRMQLLSCFFAVMNKNSIPVSTHLLCRYFS